jgi:hypothetical protein
MDSPHWGEQFLEPNNIEKRNQRKNLISCPNHRSRIAGNQILKKSNLHSQVMSGRDGIIYF